MHPPTLVPNVYPMKARVMRWGTPFEQIQKVLKADTGANATSMANQVDLAVAVVVPRELGTNGSWFEGRENIATVPAEPLDIFAVGMGTVDHVHHLNLPALRSQILVQTAEPPEPAN